MGATISAGDYLGFCPLTKVEQERLDRGARMLVRGADMDRAYELARGVYQHGILDGTEAISGATLKGTAKRYSGRYKASAKSLLARLEANGIEVHEIRVRQGGRRVLVFM